MVMLGRAVNSVGGGATERDGEAIDSECRRILALAVGVVVVVVVVVFVVVVVAAVSVSRPKPGVRRVGTS